MTNKLIVKKLKKKKDSTERMIDILNNELETLSSSKKIFKPVLYNAKIKYLEDYYALERVIEILIK